MIDSLGGSVVRTAEMKSGASDFMPHSDHQLDLSQVIPGSTPLVTLAHSQVICLLQVGIINLLDSFK